MVSSQIVRRRLDFADLGSMAFPSTNHRLEKQATDKLRTWFNMNYEQPYPTDEDVECLANGTGLTAKQVKTWFANTRRRIRNSGKQRSLNYSLADVSYPQSFLNDHHKQINRFPNPYQIKTERNSISESSHGFLDGYGRNNFQRSFYDNRNWRPAERMDSQLYEGCYSYNEQVDWPKERQNELGNIQRCSCMHCGVNSYGNYMTLTPLGYFWNNSQPIIAKGVYNQQFECFDRNTCYFRPQFHSIPSIPATKPTSVLSHDVASTLERKGRKIDSSSHDYHKDIIRNVRSIVAKPLDKITQHISRQKLESVAKTRGMPIVTSSFPSTVLPSFSSFLKKLSPSINDEGETFGKETGQTRQTGQSTGTSLSMDVSSVKRAMHFDEEVRALVKRVKHLEPVTNVGKPAIDTCRELRNKDCQRRSVHEENINVDEEPVDVAKRIANVDEQAMTVDRQATNVNYGIDNHPTDADSQQATNLAQQVVNHNEQATNLVQQATNHNEQATNLVQQAMNHDEQATNVVNLTMFKGQRQNFSNQTSYNQLQSHLHRINEPNTKSYPSKIANETDAHYADAAHLTMQECWCRYCMAYRYFLSARTWPIHTSWPPSPTPLFPLQLDNYHSTTHPGMSSEQSLPNTTNSQTSPSLSACVGCSCSNRRNECSNNLSSNRPAQEDVSHLEKMAEPLVCVDKLHESKRSCDNSEGETTANKRRHNRNDSSVGVYSHNIHISSQSNITVRTMNSGLVRRRHDDEYYTSLRRQNGNVRIQHKTYSDIRYVSSQSNRNISSRYNADISRQPDTSISKHDTSISSQHDTNISSQQETNISSQSDTNISSQHDTNISSQHDANISSQQETNISSQSDTNISSQHDTNISSQHDANISSQQETNISSQSDTNISSQSDTNISSQHDTNISSQHDRNISKQHDTNISSQHDTNISSQHDTNISKQHDTNISKQHDTNISSQHDTNISKQHDTNISGKHDTNISKQHDTNISSLHDTNISSLHDTNISSQHDTNISSQHDTNISSQHDTNISSQSDTNISKQPDTNVSRQHVFNVNNSQHDTNLTSPRNFLFNSEGHRPTNVMAQFSHDIFKSDSNVKDEDYIYIFSTSNNSNHGTAVTNSNAVATIKNIPHHSGKQTKTETRETTTKGHNSQSSYKFNERTDDTVTKLEGRYDSCQIVTTCGRMKVTESCYGYFSNASKCNFDTSSNSSLVHPYLFQTKQDIGSKQMKQNVARSINDCYTISDNSNHLYKQCQQSTYCYSNPLPTTNENMTYFPYRYPVSSCENATIVTNRPSLTTNIDHYATAYDQDALRSNILYEYSKHGDILSSDSSNSSNHSSHEPAVVVTENYESIDYSNIFKSYDSHGYRHKGSFANYDINAHYSNMGNKNNYSNYVPNESVNNRNYDDSRTDKKVTSKSLTHNASYVTSDHCNNSITNDSNVNNKGTWNHSNYVTNAHYKDSNYYDTLYTDREMSSMSTFTDSEVRKPDKCMDNLNNSNAASNVVDHSNFGLTNSMYMDTKVANHSNINTVATNCNNAFVMNNLDLSYSCGMGRYNEHTNKPRDPVEDRNLSDVTPIGGWTVEGGDNVRNDRRPSCNYGKLDKISEACSETNHLPGYSSKIGNNRLAKSSEEFFIDEKVCGSSGCSRTSGGNGENYRQRRIKTESAFMVSTNERKNGEFVQNHGSVCVSKKEFQPRCGPVDHVENAAGSLSSDYADVCDTTMKNWDHFKIYHPSERMKLRNIDVLSDYCACKYQKVAGENKKLVVLSGEEPCRESGCEEHEEDGAQLEKESGSESCKADDRQERFSVMNYTCSGQVDSCWSNCVDNKSSCAIINNVSYLYAARSFSDGSSSCREATEKQNLISQEDKNCESGQSFARNDSNLFVTTNFASSTKYTDTKPLFTNAAGSQADFFLEQRKSYIDLDAQYGENTNNSAMMKPIAYLRPNIRGKPWEGQVDKSGSVRNTAVVAVRSQSDNFASCQNLFVPSTNPLDFELRRSSPELTDGRSTPVKKLKSSAAKYDSFTAPLNQECRLVSVGMLHPPAEVTRVSQNQKANHGSVNSDNWVNDDNSVNDDDSVNENDSLTDDDSANDDSVKGDKLGTDDDSVNDDDSINSEDSVNDDNDSTSGNDSLATDEGRTEVNQVPSAAGESTAMVAQALLDLSNAPTKVTVKTESYENAMDHTMSRLE